MKRAVGILAYGSLIANPGEEIESATVETTDGITTPFNVEFARRSKERRNAPTLVPVTTHGAPVRARLFALNVSEAEATNRLYRREINKVGSGRCYRASQKPGPNTVIVNRLHSFEGVDIVLYTQLASNIQDLNAETLAALAIKSARSQYDGRDGISYLIDAKKYGVETLLSEAYEEEIKKQTRANDLYEALRKARIG